MAAYLADDTHANSMKPIKQQNQKLLAKGSAGCLLAAMPPGMERVCTLPKMPPIPIVLPVRARNNVEKADLHDKGHSNTGKRT